MKSIFENEFVCTKNYYKEYYQYICFKSSVMLIINIILTINFMISILSLIFFKLPLLDFMTAQTNIATVLIIISIEIGVFLAIRIWHIKGT